MEVIEKFMKETNKEPFPKNYMVTVTDTATYVIRAASEEAAKNIALDYFNERTPDFDIKVTAEEAEVEI